MKITLHVSNAVDLRTSAMQCSLNRSAVTQTEVSPVQVQYTASLCDELKSRLLIISSRGISVSRAERPPRMAMTLFLRRNY